MTAESLTWSFHTHSEYCDGQGTLRQMVTAAVGAGLTDVGFSSHAPLPFETGWNMKLSRLPAYLAEIQELRREFDGRINLWLGAELDYIPGGEAVRFQASNLSPACFDYFVGSVHFLGVPNHSRAFDGTEAEFRAILAEEYGSSIQALVADYYRRVALVPALPGVAIVGHLDVVKRWNANRDFFTGDETWYRAAVEGALSAIAASGALVELNTAGWRKGLNEPYPARWILMLCRELGIPITVSADAHAPDQVCWGYDRAESLLAEISVTPVNPAEVVRRAKG